jgi:hypothetical protein
MRLQNKEVTYFISILIKILHNNYNCKDWEVFGEIFPWLAEMVVEISSEFDINPFDLLAWWS